MTKSFKEQIASGMSIEEIIGELVTQAISEDMKREAEEIEKIVLYGDGSPQPQGVLKVSNDPANRR